MTNLLPTFLTPLARFQSRSGLASRPSRRALALTLGLLMAGPAAFAQAPANDDCAGATPLTAGSTAVPVLATNVDATASTGVADPSCANYAGGDVWFSVIVPASGNLRVRTSATPGGGVSDTGLSVYSGTCGSLTELDCNDDYLSGFSQLTLIGLTPGQPLLLRTWVYDNSHLGSYTVSAEALDPCTTPGSLAVGNVGASRAEVSFTETALTPGDYEATYTPAGGAALTEHGASSPIRLTHLLPNTTYTVTVASPCGSGFTAPSAPVSFTTAPAPVNDEPAGALPLAVGTVCAPVRGSNANASATTSVPDPGCADYNGDDLWYSVVVPANGIVTLETAEVAGSPVYDTGLAVYGGAPGSLALLACDDNNGFSYTSYIRLTGQTPGATLYVRAWSNGNYTHGEFVLCATTDDAAPVTEWLGTSHDWFDAANWSSGVPTAATNAHVGNVPSGLYPELTSGAPAEVHSLVVDKYAGFAHHAGTLAVSGNLLSRASAEFVYFDNTSFATMGGEVALRGTGPQQVLGLSEAYDVTVDAAGPVTLLTQLRLDHQLTATTGVLKAENTLVELYSDNPFLGEFFSSARLSETETGYVLGQVQYRSGVYDETPNDFGGVGLTLTSDAAATDVPGGVRLNRFTGVAPTGVNGRAGITRTFALEPDNDSNLNLTMDFQYFAHERNGIADTELGLYSAPTNAAGPWTLSSGTSRQAPSVAAAPSIITASGLTHLSSWTLGSTAAPLPVALTRFTAEPAGPAALLRWATASEKNNDHFDIEASADGRTFARIGQREGHGSTSQASTYELRDANLARYGSALVYYRLRQVDASGSASFSPVRTVAVAGAGASAAFVATAFPVPFTESLTVRVQALAAGPARLTLRDAWGRELLRETTALTPGTHDVPLPATRQLAAGIYLLTVEQNGQTQQLKVSRE